MKKSKFTEEQIVRILKEVDGNMDLLRFRHPGLPEPRLTMSGDCKGWRFT